MANYVLTHTGAQVDAAIDAALDPISGNAALSQSLSTHVANKSNPHSVTTDQIGAATIQNLNAHVANRSNPHNVTPAQIGALPVSGGTVTGVLTGTHEIDIRQNDGQRTTKLIAWGGNSWIRNSVDDQHYAQLILTDNDLVFNTQQGDAQTHNSVIRTDTIGNYAARSASGSYVGTGTYGASNPCSIAFGFMPKVVFVSRQDGVQMSNGMWMLGTSGMQLQYGSSLYFNPVSWNGNVMTWYSETNVQRQFNVAGVTYTYLAY